jgi:tetratricopeptide (TPR) repeat protein
LVKSLRRALVEDPAARWQSAAAMRAALEGRGQRWWLIPAAAVAALLAWVLWPPPPPPDYFVLRLDRLELVGAGPGVPWHDSVRAALAERLRGFPDFVVDTQGDSPYTLSISGSVNLRGDSLRADLYTRAGTRTSRSLVAPPVSVTGWRPLVDSLTNAVLRTIWVENTGEFGSLPLAALPESPRGTERWLRAEFSYGDGNWLEARQGYEEAVAVDSSCLLCAYRIMDLDRWLSRPVDSLRLQTLLANLDRFPVEYRHVITASALPPRARIDSLRAMAARHPLFFDLQYHLGDELLHRGPLVGISRDQATEQLREARRLRPDFAGVAEHLAWALIVEGQGDSARAVLNELERQHQPRNVASAGPRVFHEIAWQWRFQSASEAAAVTSRQLAKPGILEFAELPAGPRALPALGVPEGAVGFGRMLVAYSDRPDLVRSGLVAMWLGATGLGRYRNASEAVERLREATADPGWRIAPLQLAALRQALGELAPEEAAPGPALQALADRSGQSAGVRDRARWSLAVNGQLAADPGDTTVSGLLQRAVALATSGQPGQALLVFDSLMTGNLHRIDPTAAATVWLLRASWLGAAGRHAEAAAELLKLEHSDFPGLPRGELLGVEIDWALGTLALWRRAAHLEVAEERGRELCRLYAEVARRWAGGDPGPAARADSANRRSAALRCGVAR